MAWTYEEMRILRSKCLEELEASNGKKISWTKIVESFGGTRNYDQCRACWRAMVEREHCLQKIRHIPRKTNQENESPLSLPEFACYSPATPNDLFNEYGKELVLTPLYYPIRFGDDDLNDDVWNCFDVANQARTCSS
jgi:hypothetical protein